MTATNVRRVRVADSADALTTVKLVELAADGRRRRQAIILRDESGKLQAYLNLCRHLPVPLDSLRGDVLSEDERFLECRTHGAQFALDTGLCVVGPCEGLPLHRLQLAENEDGLFVLDHTPPEPKS